jgi:uncharacterized protein (DUF2147 family)
MRGAQREDRDTGPNVTLDRNPNRRKAWAHLVTGEENPMKTFALAAAFAVFGAAAMADPLEGVWQTEVDDGAFAHVTIAPCAAAYCGKITSTFKDDGSAMESPNKGKTIVIDMVPQGDGAYEGSVFRPSNGKTYYGTIALNGNKLKLSGCVAGGLICAKQNWTRVK